MYRQITEANRKIRLALAGFAMAEIRNRKNIMKTSPTSLEIIKALVDKLGFESVIDLLAFNPSVFLNLLNKSIYKGKHQ